MVFCSVLFVKKASTFSNKKNIILIKRDNNSFSFDNFIGEHSMARYICSVR